MHELSLMQSLRQIALEEAARHGGGRIRSLRLRLGTVSGVDPEALRFAFAVLMEAEPTRGARLEIETVEAQARCLDCGLHFACADGLQDCPSCASLRSRLLCGRELELHSLELDSLELEEAGSEGVAPASR